MSIYRLRANLLLLILVASVSGLLIFGLGSQSASAQERVGSQITDDTARAMANCMPLYRVNVGGPQLTSIGNFPYPWEADGSAYLAGGGQNVGTYAYPATVDPAIADRVPVELFATERWDPGGMPEMTWEFPIGPVAEYDIIFYFAEMFSGNSQPGDRVFNVTVEDTPVLTNFDIAATHGFRYGVAHAHTVFVSDHSLSVEFTRMTENPTIHGFEIIPHTCQNMYPYANDDLVTTGMGTPVTHNILTNDGDDQPLDITTVDLDPVTDGQQLSVTNPGQATFDYNTATGEVTVTPIGAFLGATQIDYTVRDSTFRLSNVATLTAMVYETVDCPALYRVNAGGPQLAALDGGVPWGEDRAAAGARAYGAATAGIPSPFVNAAAMGDYTYGVVQNVFMPLDIDPTVVPSTVFQTERLDNSVSNPNMVWTFPGLDPRDYKVNLYFAEIFYTTAGSRTFDIYIEGSQVADDLDLFAAAGGRYIAIQQSYVANVVDGTLEVEFVQGMAGNPKLSAIEIVPATCPEEPPVQMVNNPLTVAEGAAGTITTAELVYADSVEQANQIIFTVTNGPTNGVLNMTTFTQADIEASMVTYTHNGSETTADNFTFMVSDGELFADPGVFNIQITPTDDAPVLVTNNTLNVNAGLSGVIDDTLLQTTDIDTVAADLTYTVTGGPAAGVLSATSFTQADVDAGAITYTHDGSDTLTDSFTFVVSDLTTPLAAATFNILVDPTVNPNPYNLMVAGNTTTYPLDLTYTWQHRLNVTDINVPADRYRIYISIDGAVAVDKWLDADSICTGIDCAFTYMDKRPAYVLRNGTYSWWVGGQMPDGSMSWSDEATFIIDVPPTQVPGNVTVAPNQGRPTISWDDDASAMWFEIYIGDENGRIFQEWVDKTGLCHGSRCNFVPNVDPKPGEHTVWMRAWGPNGLSTGGAEGWAGPVAFTVTGTLPGVVSSGFNAVNNGDGLSVVWDGVDNATWYHVWLGESDSNGNYTTHVMRWQSSVSLNCLDGGQCSLPLPSSVGAGTYTWAVQAWGPAGFNNGDEDAWSELQTFVVEP